MGPIWAPYGAPYRAPYMGPHIGPIWGPYGPHLDPIWAPYGAHMGPHLGPHLGPLGPRCCPIQNLGPGCYGPFFEHDCGMLTCNPLRFVDVRPKIVLLKHRACVMNLASTCDKHLSAAASTISINRSSPISAYRKDTSHGRRRRNSPGHRPRAC